VPNDDGPVLVFDGDCGFCTTSATWIAARWTGREQPRAVPWQRLGPARLKQLGLSAEDVARAAWWVEDGRRWGAQRAVARALQAAGGGWGVVGTVLLAPPVSGIAAVGYRIVARYRHRLPGGTPACRT
jgi:predicted DCC family thiol-disulfide oxidoreductase YuxK